MIWNHEAESALGKDGRGVRRDSLLQHCLSKEGARTFVVVGADCNDREAFVAPYVVERTNVDRCIPKSARYRCERSRSVFDPRKEDAVSNRRVPCVGEGGERLILALHLEPNQCSTTVRFHRDPLNIDAA